MCYESQSIPEGYIPNSLRVGGLAGHDGLQLGLLEAMTLLDLCLDLDAWSLNMDQCSVLRCMFDNAICPCCLYATLHPLVRRATRGHCVMCELISSDTSRWSIAPKQQVDVPPSDFLVCFETSVSNEAPATFDYSYSSLSINVACGSKHD